MEATDLAQANGLEPGSLAVNYRNRGAKGPVADPEQLTPTEKPGALAPVSLEGLAAEDPGARILSQPNGLGTDLAQGADKRTDVSARGIRRAVTEDPPSRRVVR